MFFFQVTCLIPKTPWFPKNPELTATTQGTMHPREVSCSHLLEIPPIRSIPGLPTFLLGPAPGRLPRVHPGDLGLQANDPALAAYLRPLFESRGGTGRVGEL